MIKVEIKGAIYSVDIKRKTIAIIKNHKLKFFYFQNNLMKRFKKYLYKGNFIKLQKIQMKLEVIRILTLSFMLVKFLFLLNMGLNIYMIRKI